MGGIISLGSVSSGNHLVDDNIQSLIAVYEALFPEQVRAYYLIGSYAIGETTALSDLDLIVLFKGNFLDNKEANQGRRLSQAFYKARFSSIRLDVSCRWEDSLASVDRVSLKLASIAMFGEDNRNDIVLPDRADYIREVMYFAHLSISRFLRSRDWSNVATLTYPLDYPEPNDEFYGYTQKRVFEWYPSSIAFGLKELVTTVGRIATALIALKSGTFVANRKESIRLYEEIVGDEWVDYIVKIYEYGKKQWGYLVPTQIEERKLLQALCQQTLGFENSFLFSYQAYLLSELHSDVVERKVLALKRFQEVFYFDKDIYRSIQEALITDHASLKEAASRTLKVWDANLHYGSSIKKPDQAFE